ncbi:hypothetical protein GWI33_001940 [Rhynchophorus ferrugineus]|uniref:Uncharacterized protein n=1 Tax=Rhynchophorus ferrugineus TaxID=354439 RepID=A0A834IYV6_RHYFE|nr:hypothetical protein GWI33_001940 [Rhynchophorus ferrugineus]
MYPSTPWSTDPDTTTLGQTKISTFFRRFQSSHVPRPTIIFSPSAVPVVFTTKSDRESTFWTNGPDTYATTNQTAWGRRGRRRTRRVDICSQTSPRTDDFRSNADLSGQILDG